MSGDEEGTGANWLWGSYDERDALAREYLLRHGAADMIAPLGLDRPAVERRPSFDAHTHYERGSGWRSSAVDPKKKTKKKDSDR